MSKSATNLNGIETDIFHLPYEIVFNMCSTEIRIARLTHLKKGKKAVENSQSCPLKLGISLCFKR